MNLLAIETSSDACSIALQIGEDVIDNHVVKPREHTRILLPMIQSVLTDAGIAATDLDALILGNGPGSFIGMRIGASVAQGICYGANIGIVPVSSMAAVAAQAFSDEEVASVVVAQDARMGEVYVGQYVRSDENLPVSRGEERIVEIGLIDNVYSGYTAAGSAWHKYRDLLDANRPNISEVADIRTPHASSVLAIGRAEFESNGSIAPERLHPAYLRTKVAEVPGSAVQK